MAVTTWTEALRRKRAAVGRLSERAGRNASERRAGLENVNAEDAPPRSRGKRPATDTVQRGANETGRSSPPRYWRRHVRAGGVDATREALSVARTHQPGTLREGASSPNAMRYAWHRLTGSCETPPSETAGGHTTRCHELAWNASATALLAGLHIPIDGEHRPCLDERSVGHVSRTATVRSARQLTVPADHVR